MQTAAPVDSNIRLLLVQFNCTSNRTSSRELTKLEKAVENRAVLADIETLHLFSIVVHVVGSDALQEFDIVVTMELRHIIVDSLRRTIHLHLAIKAIVQQEVMGHAYAMGLHWMPLTVVVISDIALKEKNV